MQKDPLIERRNTYFQAVRSEDAVELLRANKNAFVLLYVIAYRARRCSGFNRYNLQPGEALIGDHEECGMTEKEYRIAKQFLKKFHFAAFRGTTLGTVATLTSTTVFDINMELQGERTDTQGADEGRAEGEQGADEGRAEGEQGATNKNDKNDKKEKNDKCTAASAADSQHRTFIDLWIDSYQSQFQSKYVFQHAKDGAAVKKLLASTGKVPAELIGVAQQAWSRPGLFNCRQAVTIAGFYSRYNEIMAELREATNPAFSFRHSPPPVGKFTPEDNLKPF